MIRLLHRSLHLCEQTRRLNPTLLRSLYSSIPKSQTPSNPTVSYLTDSCGLSLSSALSASKKLLLKSHQNPNAVLSLLKDHSFTKTQIANLVARQPNLLLADPEKIIKPKLDFFFEMGYPRPEVARLLSSDPTPLLSSLDKKLKHNFRLLISVLDSNKAAAATALTNWSRLLHCNFEKVVLPNVKLLQDHGVPLPNIVKLATKYPRSLLHTSDRFRTTVGVLAELDINPASMMFVYAIRSMCGMTVLKWEQKLAAYKSLGWSDEETISAFGKDPTCMLASEEKIRRVIGFYVEKFGMETSFLSARPKLLTMSFEKRIVPRCAVLDVLSAKGLVSKKMGVYKFLMMGERDFLEKYVTKHQDQVPEVVMAYQGAKQPFSSKLTHHARIKALLDASADKKM